MLQPLRLTALRAWSRSLSSSPAPRGRAREIALELAKKRRAGLEATLSESASSSAESSSSASSLSGVGLVAALGLVGAGALAASTEEGSRLFDKYLYRGTPLGAAIDAVRGQIGDTVKPFTDPIAEDLLPDFPSEQLPPGADPPRTLVVDFEDTLCHLEWDRRNGWRAVKRPGVDQFLRRLCMQYEIVLFSSGHQMFLEPFVMSLDPGLYISHRLFRESTMYENGVHIKDLSHLNRDLSRVVVIDDQPKYVSKQPENLIAIKPFVNPAEPDTALVDIIPFLEDLVDRDVKDVRAEIAKYAGKDLAATFKREKEERQRQAMEARKNTLGSAIQRGLRGSAPPAPPPAHAMPIPEPQIATGMTPLHAVESLSKENKPQPTVEPVKPAGLWGSLMK